MLSLHLSDWPLIGACALILVVIGGAIWLVLKQPKDDQR